MLIYKILAQSSALILLWEKMEEILFFQCHVLFCGSWCFASLQQLFAGLSELLTKIDCIFGFVFLDGFILLRLSEN